jgi:hypothetical protein
MCFPSLSSRRRRMSEVFGGGCGIQLRHACAHAAEVYRRCMINKETIARVAHSLDLDMMQTEGVFRIVRHCGGAPSPERMAVIAMKDWGLDDSDIAEMFDRSERWAALCREQAAEIRESEPIPESLEYLDVGLCPGDPSPAELQTRVAELRGTGVIKGLTPTRRPGLRAYLWNGASHAFFPIGVE